MMTNLQFKMIQINSITQPKRRS